MTLTELKEELNLSDPAFNKFAAKVFGLSYKSFIATSARKRYENAMCIFYEEIKNKL